MTVRTKEQLAVLLKLVDVNNASLTRMNCSTRQKVWQIIAQKLNGMQGAHKDMEGWKRSYYSWRLNIGTDYKKQLQKIIKNVADDDFFYINVFEDVVENDNASDGEEVFGDNPSEKQKKRLHELVLKHREILLSTADDEPLKSRVWLNIAEELNDMPDALKLTPTEWNKRVDWEKYVMRRGRKSTKRTASIKADTNVKRFITDNQTNAKNIEFEVLGNDTTDTLDSQDVDSPEEAYPSMDELIIEELEPEPPLSTNDPPNQFEEYQENNCHLEEEVTKDMEMLLNDDDNNANDEDNYLDHDEYEDELEYKPQVKRICTPPIAKSFKYSHRLVSAVEKLSSDVGDMKDLLKRTSRTLECLESVLQQQSKQHNETNALLKRNGQLLKVLVECKTGRRANGHTK